MKIHKTLERLFVINTVGCFALFYSLYYFSSRDKNDMGIALAIGWIFWLGIVAYVEPLFFSDNTRGEWFSKEYGVGTIVALFGNVLVAIACNSLVYSFIPAK